MAKKTAPTDLTPEEIAELQEELARTKKAAEKAAEKAISSLNVRIPATLHEDIRDAADLKNMTQQEYVTETLKRSVKRILKK